VACVCFYFHNHIYFISWALNVLCVLCTLILYCVSRVLLLCYMFLFDSSFPGRLSTLLIHRCAILKANGIFNLLIWFLNELSYIFWPDFKVIIYRSKLVFVLLLFTVLTLNSRLYIEFTGYFVLFCFNITSSDWI